MDWEPGKPLTSRDLFGDIDYLFKLTLIGDSRVGKSSLLRRFNEDDFNESGHEPTIGVDFAVPVIRVDSSVIKLQIWDTGGGGTDGQFAEITSSYLRGHPGIIMVYDVTNPQSLEVLRDWAKVVESYSTEDVVLVVVGNKSDRESARAVSTEEGEAFCQSVGADLFLETSAKDGANVQRMFLRIAQEIKKREDARNQS